MTVVNRAGQFATNRNGKIEALVNIFLVWKGTSDLGGENNGPVFFEDRKRLW